MKKEDQQKLSQLSEVERNARTKGHFGRARNLREAKNELDPPKPPRKRAAKKTAAKKTAAKKAAPAAKKAPAKKTAKKS